MAEILSRIREKKGSSPKVWRQIADFVLENAARIPNMRLEDLRRELNVSDGSIINFVHSLDCEGFGHFKVLIAQANGGLSARYAKSRNERSSLARIAEESKCAIDEARTAVEEGDILHLARRLAAKEGRVLFMGKETSAHIARIFAGYLLLLGIPSTVLDGTRECALYAKTLGKNDMAIAISFSGATPEIVSAIGEAKASGAHTVCLTSFGGSRLAKLCDTPIVISSPEAKSGEFPITARVAELVICNAICAEISEIQEKRKEEM